LQAPELVAERAAEIRRDRSAPLKLLQSCAKSPVEALRRSAARLSRHYPMLTQSGRETRPPANDRAHH
jgi:hypothetical protein